MPYLGEIAIFASGRVPRGYAPCDGQLLPIASYQPLFSILGTIYGGDGRSTFALPDFRGRAPVHQGYAFDVTERKPGEHGGSGKVTLQPYLTLNFCISLEGVFPRFS